MSTARLQYSVTQFMSWVTRTTALAASTISMTRAFDFARNVGVAGREDLVEQQDVRVDRGRDGEAEPRAHARRIGLERRVDELAELGVLDDRRQELAGHRVVEAEERPAEQDVVAARSAPGRSRRRGSAGPDTWPRTSTAPSDGRMIPARTWSSVLLPAPFGPMTASDSPCCTRRTTWRSAQNWLDVAAPEHLAERAADRRLAA